MNKKSLTTIVGAALMFGAAYANAAPTVYGSARVALESCTACTSQDPDSWTMFNAGSRLGVRGSEDLGGGMSAIYNYEFGVDIDGGAGFDPGDRPKFVGLKGDFGTIRFGRMFHPAFDYVAGKTDVFNEGTILHQLGARASQLTYYTSPTFGGFNVGASVATGSGTDDENVDEYQIGARYNIGPVTIGAVHVSNNLTELDAQGLALTYAQGPVEVTLAGHSSEISTTVERQSIILTGQFTFGSNTIIAGVATREQDGSTAEPSIGKLEFQHKLSKVARVWATYIVEDNDDNVDNVVNGVRDDGIVQLGMRVDF